VRRDSFGLEVMAPDYALLIITVMKKKELIKEIERLNEINLDLRNDLDIVLSDGREFDKMMVAQKYQTSKDINYVMWRGDKNGNVKQFN